MTTRKTKDADSVQTNDAPAASAEKATPHYATRVFTDAGTERRFEQDDELTGIEPGVVANYAAAGLATTEKPSA